MRKLTVGDVLKYSWGYDQTNVDAFQIVRESPSSVWIRRIAVRSAGEYQHMSDRCEPVKDAFTNGTDYPPIRKARKSDEGGTCEYVVFDHGVGRLWHEGTTAYRSWYA